VNRVRRRSHAPPATPGGPPRLTVPHLEIHVTHECNLSCDGCLYYTNHHHAGTVPIGDLRDSLATWSQRLVPKSFAILGGEPCLHPDLTQIVYLARSYWPDLSTRIEVVTNGLLLHLHPELPTALSATNTSLYVSVHSNATISPRYHEMLSKPLELAHRWQQDYGIELDVVEQTTWYRGYKGFGAQVAPFEDGDPQKSWDNCVAGHQCFQISDGRIWKCAPLAYLKLQDRAFTLSDKWKPYLAYQGLAPECTDAQLAEFFGRQAESFCGMCPSNPATFSKGDPLKPLTFFKQPI
jgi:hypothetical protein